MADLGKVAIRPKGKYIVGAAYEMLDLVEHEGSSFLSIKDTSIAPADDGVNWMLIAKKGIDDIATADLAGVVKPDGITITIDEDGTLHGASQVPEGVTYVKFEEPEVPPEGEEPPVNPALNDADTLGGNPPEHYATADKVEKVKAAVNEIIGNLEEISNDNILINPDFSINQRGQETYTCVNYTYTVDRWATHYNTTVNVKEKGVQISVNNAGGGLYQRVNNFEKYRGKTVTLSAEISKIQQSSQEGATLKLVIHDGIKGAEADATRTGITHLTYTISDNATRLLIYFLYTKNGVSSGTDIDNTIADIEWIKLEEGAKATAFKRPQSDLEILKCMRYTQTLKSLCDTCRDLNESGVYYQIKYLPMRTIPTGRFSNSVFNNSSGAYITDMAGNMQSGFSFSIDAYDNTHGQVIGRKSNHGLIKAEGARMEFNANYVILDAEMY